jgi:hypothetical protein
MTWRQEWRWAMLLLGGFLAVFYLPGRQRPVRRRRDRGAAPGPKWYAREHVILCLIPALFIAGAISVFVSQAAVMKYLGAGRTRRSPTASPSVSGTVLAVCSCTVLPLFGGIYKRGAGLGPAAAFLYSGPAINVLAIVLTARMLGFELGLARAVGAVVFSVVIGLLMHAIFRREEAAKVAAAAALPAPPAGRPSIQDSDLLRVDGRHPGVRELGRAPGGSGLLPAGVLGEVAAHGAAGPRLRRDARGWLALLVEGGARASSRPAAAARVSRRAARPVLGGGRGTRRAVTSTDTGEGASGSRPRGSSPSRSCRSCSSAC